MVQDYYSVSKNEKLRGEVKNRTFQLSVVTWDGKWLDNVAEMSL
jgi:hypothetical protein